MSTTVIAVENLSKRYVVGHQTLPRDGYIALRDVIAREACNFARKATDVVRGRQIVQGDELEEFWALRNVSFEVKQGEVIGIIGRNGAGKSTLLKILSRITEPTEGRALVRGRVASLLEIGTGFHSELTGRENIFLNGAILGMTQREIRKKFDEIVAFAEVERFLDTPVKRYSSGMYLRLAFAVAAYLEPEILIVDEVLAVGDAEFQRKCLGKMEEVSRLGGRTVLFVSHNMGAIAGLCASAIWLDVGSIYRWGATRDVIGEYLVHGVPSQDRRLNLNSIQRSGFDSSDDRLRLESMEWLCGLPLRNGAPLKARINFNTRTPLANIALGITFFSVDRKRLLSYSTDFQQEIRQELTEPGAYSVEIEVDSLPLTPDIYVLDITCRSGDTHILDYIRSATQLDVIAGPSTPGFIGKGGGVRLVSKWTWQHGHVQREDSSRLDRRVLPPVVSTPK